MRLVDGARAGLESLSRHREGVMWNVFPVTLIGFSVALWSPDLFPGSPGSGIVTRSVGHLMTMTCPKSEITGIR